MTILVLIAQVTTVPRWRAFASYATRTLSTVALVVVDTPGTTTCWIWYAFAIDRTNGTLGRSTAVRVLVAGVVTWPTIFTEAQSAAVVRSTPVTGWTEAFVVVVAWVTAFAIFVLGTDCGKENRQ